MLTAFFCDDASVDAGKLHVRGIFGELAAEGFPARHDRLVLCAIVAWTDRGGRRQFVIDLLDPDGQAVFTVDGHTDVTMPVPGRAPPQSHFILPLEGVVFPVAGRYRTRFRIDGEDRFGPDLYLSAQRDRA